MDDNIVTKELEESAINLLKGFDVSFDMAVGDRLQPTRVNVRDVFLAEERMGKGNSFFHLLFVYNLIPNHSR